MKIVNDSLYLKQNKGVFSKQTVEIKLTDIDTVYLGNERFLLEHLNKTSISVLYDLYSKYSQGQFKLAGSVAIKFTPVFVIVLKDGQTFAVSTKPYSKKTFRILFHELDYKNVNIAVQKSLNFDY